MTFYAHSTERDDKSDWQLLAEHLTAVGIMADENARHFDGGLLAKVAGLLHDLGKYTKEFQLRLEGGARVDHATWGAKVACENYGDFGKLLAYAIAGHHAGLANGRAGEARRALMERLQEKLPDLLSTWESEIKLPTKIEFPKDFRPNKNRISFQQAMLCRMLFSCLVDADFLDTEAFYLKVSKQASLRDAECPRLEQLRERLDKKLAGFSADSDVNRERARILEHVRQQAELTPGLFSLTVPTGGGKTLASLAFALDHAIRHGLRRIIFVIPFTSIVEQNAKVFRDAFGDLGDAAVLEHHSAFIEDEKKSPEAEKKLKLAMENWDAPIVVTTAVQFFESLFASRPSLCRKLHNIASSVVILDEAQTMPLKLLRPCVNALDELALNYRASVVICTATQPALRAQDGFVDGLENVRELAPTPKTLYEQFRRVTVRHEGYLPDTSIVQHLSGSEQVLCIVNNRRHARALYEAIAEKEGARHLTTLMCAKHRSEVLAGVRTLLKTGEACRLVSTSLIEAGVDVDFPKVMRAEAGLDSIAQAAGRCNREGLRSRETSEVIVFAQDGTDWMPPPELKQYAQVFREIQRKYASDPLHLDAIADYFKMLYWQKGALELDAHDLLGKLQRSCIDSLPFETLSAKFKMIESVQMPVIIPFDDEARDALRSLNYAESCGGIARRLQPYIVQLPKSGYEALRKANVLQAVQPDRYGEQFMELMNPDLYHQRYGLSWDDPVFIKAENLVW